MKLGITEYIDCAHSLAGHHKCGQIHGHTYKIEVMVEGENAGGMVIDFGILKAQTRAVLQEYDHRSWNEFLDYPSVENICELISGKLRERLHLPLMIRVWEGHGKWAEK